MTAVAEVHYFVQEDPFGGGGLDRALTAAGFPVKPPSEWFDNPNLSGPTPLTVTREGRVFGHIAPWNARHVGLPGDVRPPKSRTNYSFFNKGLLETAEGKDVTVGQLTLAGGHAPLHADASRAVEHYDNTKSAAADIHVGEDTWGIWAAGAVRPDVDDLKLRALRASVPSGDWRPIDGGLELVAVCQVNSGGFPVARQAIAASSYDADGNPVAGECLALVAAGAQAMYELKYDSMVRRSVRDRVTHLESVVASLTGERDRARAALRARVYGE